MNLLEFIGFIGMLLFMLASMRQNKRRKDNPEEAEAEDAEQAQRLREFLQGIDHDMTKTKAPTPTSSPKPSLTKKQTMPQKNNKTSYKPIPNPPPSSLISDKRFNENRDVYASMKKKKGRAVTLFQSLKSYQDMVILHEIIGPPKALKEQNNVFDNSH